MTIKCAAGHENADGSAFCDECGEILGSPVPATGTPAPVPADQRGASPDTGGEQSGNTPAISPVSAVAVVAASGEEDVQSGVISPTGTAPSAVPVRLVVEADNQEFDIGGRDSIIIGREDPEGNMFPDIDLTPHGGEEGGVSRTHARLFLQGSEYMLEDLNSTNFTFLNGQRLSPHQASVLHDNDEVKLGRVVMRFKSA